MGVGYCKCRKVNSLVIERVGGVVKWLRDIWRVIESVCVDYFYFVVDFWNFLYFKIWFRGKGGI